MLLTPRLAYQREFFGNGTGTSVPAAALFRRDAFLELGGFPDEGPHSDWLFWLKACREVNTLLIYGDLYWYRIHEGSICEAPTPDMMPPSSNGKSVEALNHPDCR